MAAVAATAYVRGIAGICCSFCCASIIALDQTPSNRHGCAQHAASRHLSSGVLHLLRAGEHLRGVPPPHFAVVGDIMHRVAGFNTVAALRHAYSAALQRTGGGVEGD